MTRASLIAMSSRFTLWIQVAAANKAPAMILYTKDEGQIPYDASSDGFNAEKIGTFIKVSDKQRNWLNANIAVLLSTLFSTL